MSQPDFQSQQHGYDGQYQNQYNVPPSHIMQTSPGYDPIVFDGSSYLDNVDLLDNHGNFNIGSDVVPSQHGPSLNVGRVSDVAQLLTNGNGYPGYNQATARRNADASDEQSAPPPANNVKQYNRIRLAGNSGASSGPGPARNSRPHDGRLAAALNAGNGLSRSDTASVKQQPSPSQLATPQKPPQADQYSIAAARVANGALQAQVHALSQDVRSQRERVHNLERQLLSCRAEVQRMQGAYEEQQHSREVVLQAIAALGYRVWAVNKEMMNLSPDDHERMGVLGNAAVGNWPNEDRGQDGPSSVAALVNDLG